MVTEINYLPVRRARLLKEMRERNPLLFDLALAHLLLLTVILFVAPFDERMVTGINPWIKPMKFALSIAIYLFTIGWLLGDLPAGERSKRLITWGIAATLTLEMILITMQAARGVPSHFNQSSAFNAAVFAVMGLAITVNTALVAWMALRFWRSRPNLPAPYLWGVRLGLLIFIVASLEGFVMAGMLAHSVGVPDGGPGLPFVNWSTRGGDLRVAHFFGMHALQVLPLAGYLLSQKRARWVILFGAAYGVVSLLLFLLALAGRPLISL